jgi:hypothetical protein
MVKTVWRGPPHLSIPCCLKWLKCPIWLEIWLPIVSHPRLPKGDPSTHLYRFRVQTTFESVEKTLSETRLILLCIICISIYIHLHLSLSRRHEINHFSTFQSVHHKCLIKGELFHKCYFKKNIATTKTTLQNFLEAPHDSGSYALVNCLQSGKSHVFPSANH